ncbi:unnamed protein product [Paramecium pentaurelia]|uniref:Uncharacterized protein n=1 Tax=Paramecium pentaurelia TaxID=43138 RepID=A0A8S1XJR0_9CILI|nr:unnamed protein product [Paramecium pentaurelia]
MLLDVFQKQSQNWWLQSKYSFYKYVRILHQTKRKQFLRMSFLNSLCSVSLNEICQDRRYLQICQSMNSLQLCANSIRQEGYCTYQNQSCQVLSNCTQLKSIFECFLFDKACQQNTSYQNEIISFDSLFQYIYEKCTFQSIT